MLRYTHWMRDLKHARQGWRLSHLTLRCTHIVQAKDFVCSGDAGACGNCEEVAMSKHADDWDMGVCILREETGDLYEPSRGDLYECCSIRNVSQNSYSRSSPGRLMMRMHASIVRTIVISLFPVPKAQRVRTVLTSVLPCGDTAIQFSELSCCAKGNGDACKTRLHRLRR